VTVELRDRLEVLKRQTATAATDEAAQAREQDRLRLLSELATVGGRQTAEEDIIFRGSKLVLPESMDMVSCITFLLEKLAEDEKKIGYARTFNYRAWDGARATMHALRKAFGTVSQRGVPGFFGEKPPQLITIPVSPTETDQVPWGGLGVIHLPGLTMYLSTDHSEEYGNVFRITAEGPRKYRHEVEGIFRLIEEELRTNSLYRGKAFDGQQTPQFLDLSGIDPRHIIYSDHVETELEAHVWSLLRYSDEMKAVGESLKRAVLLEGPYGSGKTMAAFLTAQIAEANGWTFILCRPGRDDLFDVMATARLYEPAVVFLEDLDGAQQDDNVRELLDIFDGIKSKNTRIVCVLTTNHVTEIHRGMMRPGRLDAVIHVGGLDAHGIRRLVEATVPVHLMGEKIDWDAVTTAMEGYLPAFLREAVGRAKRYNMARNGGKITQLETTDFVAAADGLRSQLALMEGASETIEKDTLTSSLRGLVKDVVRHQVDGAIVTDLMGEPEFKLMLTGNGIS
jgi:transitional endoplasmic reticulum ATPase